MADPQSGGSDNKAPPAVPQQEGRLVLTPALRVPAVAQPVPDAPAVTAADTGDDALHRAVRAIIEEELRGDFGTRITREVRKLVRAEVRTLLAARDPD